jgi:hypothetical protein
MVTLFFSYSHKDEALRDQLEIHLAMLKRQGVISTWHDRRLIAGSDLDAGISRELECAEIILLLISPDFLASEYCYSVEMTHALQRHEAGEARVIPVILRPCDWTHAPFGKLLAAPRDGKPVTRWPDTDEAFLDIATAIREAASTTSARPAATTTTSTLTRIIHEGHGLAAGGRHSGIAFRGVEDASVGVLRLRRRVQSGATAPSATVAAWRCGWQSWQSRLGKDRRTAGRSGCG